MDEKIEYENVKKAADEVFKSDVIVGQGDLNLWIETIRAITGRDVVEVRHGEWIESFSCGVWHYDCPFCNDGYATKERQEKTENYCSNCGAKKWTERWF